LSVRDLSTAAQVAALEAGELDVGFVRMPAGRLAAEPVLTDRLALVSRADAARGAEMPFLVLSREVSPTFHDHVLATCRAAGIVPRRVQEAGDLLTLLTLAQAGVGVGLAPESARALGLADLRFRRVRVAEARWEIGMVARAGAAAARFAAMARRGLTRGGSGRTLPAASG
jgi:DNA-binding transcriptional LysR family regulator